MLVKYIIERTNIYMNGCKTLIEAIDKRIELALKNCKYEYSDTGKVISISDNRKTAMVEIRGATFSY